MISSAYLYGNELTKFYEKFPKFSTWYGSSKGSHQHHFFEGGLEAHTKEVIDTSINTAAYYGLDTWYWRCLAVAGLWHDVGKLWDYNEETHEYTTHAKEIGHLTRSCIEFEKMNEQHRLYPKDMTNVILHCIVSHHGLKEWGSPRSPQSDIAWILHCSDNMSAKLSNLNGGMKRV